MMLFKTQLVHEAPRHVAGPYRGYFSPRYGRRIEWPKPYGASTTIACNDDGDRLDHDAHIAECDTLRRMAGYDIAA